MLPRLVAGIHLKEAEKAVFDVQDAACRNAKTLDFNDGISATEIGWLNAMGTASNGESRIEAPVCFRLNEDGRVLALFSKGEETRVGSCEQQRKKPLRELITWFWRLRQRGRVHGAQRKIEGRR